MYQGLQSLAPILITNAARNVQSGRLWRDNNVAAFEQELGGHRNGFSRLGIAGHLYIYRLAWGQPFYLAQKCRAIGGAQEHTALAFHRAVRNCTIDRARGGADALK